MQDDRSTAPQRGQDCDVLVYDGREAVGWVRPIGSVFVAYGAGGKLLGRYPSQQQAVRAIPSGVRAAGSSR
jgi:hypothetical protein